MVTRILRFNLYLTVATLILCGAGCKSMGKKKEATTLGLYLEVNADGTDHNGPVTVGRAEPFQVNVEKRPFLTEISVIDASVADVLGGYQILIQYDRHGTWLLDQYTTASRGKRMAIFSTFGEARWLAAPLITRRITDGLLAFTPDVSREEADRIVRGLKNVAKEVKKGNR